MALQVTKLSPLGARIDGVDAALALSGAIDPHEVLHILEHNGIVLFPRIGLDDDQLVQFSEQFGELVLLKSGNPESEKERKKIFNVSLDPELNDAVYMKATFNWHIDGATDLIPSKGSFLTARVLPEDGGATLFASTYQAYERLSDDEKAHFETLKVVHTLDTAWLNYDPNAGPEILERLRRVPPTTHPLVWTHRDGRKSLVLGTTASHIEGWDKAEGRAFLDDLLDRVTAPEHVYTHEWEIGDLVIWDNRGALHRARPYSETSGRRMSRTTLVGDEAIQ